jgi:hypothetical protein
MTASRPPSSTASVLALLGGLALLLAGCIDAGATGSGQFGAGQDGEGGQGTGQGDEGGDGTDGTGDGQSDSGGDGDDGGNEQKFDVGAGLDIGGSCSLPEHAPCDAGGSDPFHALGVNCPDEWPIDTSTGGNPEALGVRASLGPTDAFSPREGERYAIMGSGYVQDIDKTVYDPSCVGPYGGIPQCCSRDLDLIMNMPEYDPGFALPAPIALADVGSQSCEEDPSLVGTGDCSNTLEAEFSHTTLGARDYTEMRLATTVPADATSFSFDFVYLTVEWPTWWESQYNDIFVTWLDSEEWTGNVSFDEFGHAISVNAAFMDYLDADTPNLDENGLAHPDCPPGAGCSAPELEGTCMEGHGATRWLTTEASVNPGEDIVVVFAIMDLDDSLLDSYVLLDNFAWGCDDGPPNTNPAG